MPLVVVMECVMCPMRAEVRAPMAEGGRDMALAAGWAVVSEKRKKVICPRHNPAHLQFRSFGVPKGAKNAVFKK